MVLGGEDAKHCVVILAAFQVNLAEVIAEGIDKLVKRYDQLAL